MYRMSITRSIRLSAGAAALLGMLASAAAYADTPIHLSHAAAPDAHIVIHNVKGEVRVSGWNQNRVQVDGTLGEGAKPLQISGDADTLDIRVEPTGKSGWFGFSSDNEMGPSVLDVHVPHAAALEVHVVSAPVDVTGMDGRSLQVNTVSGRVHLDAHAGAVKVGSVSADVDLEGAADGLDVQTVSGDVQAGTLNGDVNAQTVSGDLLLHGKTLNQVNLGTVSGGIQLDAAALAPGASWKVDTMSGDVRLGLPESTSAQIKADTFSGNLHSDFGKPNGSEHGPGEHLGTKVGSGNGSIVINSFSGDVHINRGSR
jgi:DUF4097 and DUF4098 domain-containing protein YvlB